MRAESNRWVAETPSQARGSGTRGDAGHNAPSDLTAEQLPFIRLMSSCLCVKLQQALGGLFRSQVGAKLVSIEPLPYWLVVNGLPLPHSTALIRCNPGGGSCLVEVDQNLLRLLFCGEHIRMYETGTPSANPETHPEGFYIGPVAGTTTSGCLVIPPRVVHAIKNGDRTLEVVAVTIESIIPTELYRLIVEAWEQAWVEIQGFELEIVGYDHDLILLEQVMPTLTRMYVVLFEMRIGDDLVCLTVSIPCSILNSEDP